VGEDTGQVRNGPGTRIRSALRWIVTPEELERKESEAKQQLRRLRSWIAFGIVLVSICSAGAVWRASVHEEAAAHHEARFRQELVLFEQHLRAAEDSVFEELSSFGSYEEHEWRSRQLAAHAALARRKNRAALAAELASDAQREARVADVLWLGFVNEAPESSTGDPAYDPVAAYESAARVELAENVDPGEFRHEATDSRRNGVNMTFSAALFIAGLVCLTLAEVPITRRLTPESAATSAGRAAWVLVLSAIGLSIAAAMLFLTIPWR
jgi:hypothetical protein